MAEVEKRIAQALSEDVSSLDLSCLGSESLPGEPGQAHDGSDGALADHPDPDGRRPSGLRDPVRAARGLGAGTLVLETVVLLLAIQPIRILGGRLSGTTIAVVVGLAVLAVVLASLLRRPWAWHAATVLQVLLVFAGLLHWSLGVLGVMFGLVWAYVLHVRRVVTS